MSNPTAALLIIGDEILSGRTKDKNIGYLAERLNDCGIDLKEVRVVADETADIAEAARALSARFDSVFTSGGIGPTHDDITADSVAAAFDVGIDVRQDAKDILTAYYEKIGIELNAARLRMTRIPDTAELIDNPVSAAPGFRIKNVYVCAGVPKIFQAMVENILPTLAKGQPICSVSIRVERPEGEIATVLGAIAGQNTEVSIGSYPFSEDGILGSNVVVRGNDDAMVDDIAKAIRQELGL